MSTSPAVLSAGVEKNILLSDSPPPFQENGLFDKFLGSVFGYTGVEGGIAVLLSFLQSYTPTTHIAISSINTKTGMVKHYYYVDAEHEFKAPMVQDFGFMSPIEQYVVKECAPVRVLLIADVYQDAAVHRLLQKAEISHRSLLTMPLFRSESHTVYMSLRAKEPGKLTVEHARILSGLYGPMRNLLDATFLSSENVHAIKLHTALERGNAFQLLSLCQGLTAVQRDIHEVADTRAGVLILGETGVGKELVAESIHSLSRRRDKPFVKVNCGAIPESLLEGELFGYEKGAFTGAIAAHKGFFEQADGGTLYLDEVGELRPETQVRLLRVLESQEVQRIGSTRRILLDFRLIAATNRDLREMTRQGAFRSDLWYRLNSFPLAVPPLRRRPEDIGILARYFVTTCSVNLELGFQPKLDDAMLKWLSVQEWPGNVRELRNWIERALLATRRAGSATLVAPPVEVDPFPPSGARAALGKPFLEIEEEDAGSLTLDELNTRYIEHVLASCRGKIQGPNSAAAWLGLKGPTLRAKMRKYGIPFQKERA